MDIKEFGEFRMFYRRGTADESVFKHSFKNDIYFAGVPEYKAQARHTIVDVGAHIGTFSVLAASKTPQGRVYAVEASRESFEYLKKNILLNKCANIIADNIALSDKNGEIKLFHDSPKGNWGHTTVKNISVSYEKVRALTLEEYIRTKKIEGVDFMKTNCEGAEFKIFLGASGKTLEKIKLILILYHEDLAKNHNKNELIRHLRGCGFRTKIRYRTLNRGWIIAQNARYYPKESLPEKIIFSAEAWLGISFLRHGQTLHWH